MKRLLTSAWPHHHDERGIVIVVAMVFIMIFLVIAVALYWLIAAGTRSTDTERSDVKALNVAEAGIDAGMLTLKQAWPTTVSAGFTPANMVAVNANLKTLIQSGTFGLWNPRNPSDFIQVKLYDNVDTNGQTTTVAYPSAPQWDSNHDGIMFVDSTGNVGNDRHRILIQAKREEWPVDISTTQAFFASKVDSNGQGVYVGFEDGTVPPPVYYDPGLDVGKKTQADPRLSKASGSDFRSLMTPEQQDALYRIATAEGTLFTSATAASAFLTSGQAGDKVVYIKSSSAVTISGNSQVGSVAHTVVVIIDTPNGSVNGWDFTGTGDFYGLLVTIGDSELRGTSGIHGALWCSGQLTNKGNGSTDEIGYNQSVLNNINAVPHIIDVSIVPNTWQEYTPPRTA